MWKFLTLKKKGIIINEHIKLNSSKIEWRRIWFLKINSSHGTVIAETTSVRKTHQEKNKWKPNLNLAWLWVYSCRSSTNRRPVSVQLKRPEGRLSAVSLSPSCAAPKSPCLYDWTSAPSLSPVKGILVVRSRTVPELISRIPPPTTLLTWHMITIIRRQSW